MSAAAMLLTLILYKVACNDAFTEPVNALYPKPWVTCIYVTSVYRRPDGQPCLLVSSTAKGDMVSLWDTSQIDCITVNAFVSCVVIMMALYIARVKKMSSF